MHTIFLFKHDTFVNCKLKINKNKKVATCPIKIKNHVMHVMYMW